MSNKNKSLPEVLTELETIVAWFDTADLDVEQAIVQFEKGSTLAEEARKQLEGLENKITVIKQRFDR